MAEQERVRADMPSKEIIAAAGTRQKQDALAALAGGPEPFIPENMDILAAQQRGWLAPEFEPEKYVAAPPVESTAPEPAPEPQIITHDLLDNLGVSPQALIRKRVVDKDFNDPAVQQQFVDFANNQKVGQEARLNVARMLEGTPDEQMELFQPRRKAGDVGAEGSESSVPPIVRETSPGPVTPEVAGTEPGGMERTDVPAEPIGAGEGEQLAALEPAAPPEIKTEPVSTPEITTAAPKEEAAAPPEIKTEPVSTPEITTAAPTYDDVSAAADTARQNNLLSQVDRDRVSNLITNKSLSPDELMNRLNGVVEKNKQGQAAPTPEDAITAAAEELYKPDIEERAAEAAQAVQARWQNEDVRYRAAPEGTPVGRPASEVSDHIDDITKGWNSDLDVKVVQGVDDLPPRLAEVVKQQGADKSPGLTLRDGNTVYMIADNLGDNADVAATLYHEALGHAGFMRTFGNKLDSVLQGIYKSNEKYRAATEAWRANNPGAYEGAANPHLRALEEVIAHEAEAGRISAPVWDRVVSAVKDFGRKLGFKLDYSNREVQAILARAHDNIIGGGKNAKATTSEGPAFARRQAAIVKANKINRDAEETTNKVKTATTNRETNVSAGKLMSEVRNVEDAHRLFKAGLNAWSTNARELFLKLFMNKDIYRAGVTDAYYLGKQRAIEESRALVASGKPGLTAAQIEKRAQDNVTSLGGIKEADALHDKLNAQRAKYIKEVDAIKDNWSKTIRKNKADDAGIADLIPTSTLNRFNPSKHASLADAIRNDKILNGDKVTPALTGKEAVARQNQIKQTWDMHDALSPEGKKIYKSVMDRYEQTFNRYYDLLAKTVKESGLNDTDKAEALKNVDKMFSEARRISVYAPLSRFGEYWFRVGTGANSEVQSFDSQTARNVALAKREEELKAAKDTRPIDQGNSMSELRSSAVRNDDLLKNIFDTLNKNTDVNSDALKDQIFQMYLSTLPGKNIQKSFIHRAERAGFSGDSFRAFVAHEYSAANQLSRLEYAGKVRKELDGAAAALKGNPDKIRLLQYVNATKRNLERELSAPPQNVLDRMATLGSKASFIMLVSPPHVALMHALQMPVLGLPSMVAKFGAAKTFKTMGRYMNLFNSMGIPTKDVDGNVFYRYGQPSVRDSKYITNHPDAAYKQKLIDGFNWGADNGTFSRTQGSDLSARASTATSEYEGPISRGGRAAYNFITGSLHHVERMTREITFMSAYEMELAKGTPWEKAAEKARSMTDEILFDWSNVNKPWVMKANPVTRIATQFMSWPIQITSFLGRNGVNMLRSLPAEDRKEAAIKFFGTLGMMAMFGGASGMPGSSAILGFADGIRHMLPQEDSDDPENPLATRDLKLWFHDVFLPKYFGRDSSLANSLGLTNEQADTLELMADRGPVSALTGIDVGPLVSMDNMFFRDETPSKNYRDAFTRFMLEHLGGPTASLGMNMATAADYFDKGDFQRGTEEIVPAFARNIMKSIRYGTEGNLTPEGEEVRNAEWYTTGKLLAQSAGLGATEAAQIEKRNIEAKSMVNEIEQERTDVLNNINRAYASGNTDAYIAALNAVTDYNARNYMLPITGSSISKSLTSRVKARTMSMQGYAPPRQLYPYVQTLFAPTEDEVSDTQQ